MFPEVMACTSQINFFRNLNKTKHTISCLCNEPVSRYCFIYIVSRISYLFEILSEVFLTYAQVWGFVLNQYVLLSRETCNLSVILNN